MRTFMYASSIITNHHAFLLWDFDERIKHPYSTGTQHTHRRGHTTGGDTQRHPELPFKIQDTISLRPACSVCVVATAT